MSRNVSHAPFLAFATDGKDIETLKAFAAAHNWPDTCIMQGDIKTAAEFLKGHTPPTLLLVEITSAGEAPAQLNALAEFCDPDTKVIVIGSTNEYSFYCWLMEIGIFSYLLKPLTAQSLDNAYGKSTDQGIGGKAAKPPAKVIAVLGARGGVGSSTVALNLAGIIANQAKKPVALVDLDPQDSTLALTLDIEPSRGLREALEKPDRIDSLFIDRVMSRPHKYLSILSAEESLQEGIVIHEEAAELLLKEVRSKFDVVVLDVPRLFTPFVRTALSQADNVVLVSDLTLAGLRDTLRISDLLRESIKLGKPPVIVANRKGMTKHEMKPSDFEKGISATIAHSIPFAPELFMPVSTEIPVLKIKTHAAAKPLYQLAEQLIPEAKGLEIVKEVGKLGGMFKGKKKADQEDTKEKEEKAS